MKNPGYTIINPSGCVIVLFSGLKYKKIDHPLIHSVGRILTLHGVERIILFVLTEPRIRYIVLVGDDHPVFKPFETLLRVWKGEENLPNIPKLYQKAFSDKILNILKIPSLRKLKNVLDSLEKPEEYPAILTIDEVEKIIKKYKKRGGGGSEIVVGSLLKCSGFEHAWLKLLSLLWFGGKRHIDNRIPTLESFSVNIIIEKPVLLEEEFSESYRQLLIPIIKSLTMGKELKIKKEIIRAFNLNSEHLKLYYRKGELIVQLYYEELEIFSSFNLELAGFSYFLSLLNKLYGGFGEIRVSLYISRAYVYRRDENQIKKVLRKYWNSWKKYSKIFFDRIGYIVIEPNHENRTILVLIYDNSGRLKESIEGKEIREIMLEILEKGLVSDPGHIAYIARELARAYYSIKFRTKYIQEAAP